MAFWISLLESDAKRCCGRYRHHSDGFYLGLCRLRGDLSLPASATTFRRRAILLCSSDGAASILKSGLEIKNRCTQEGLNREILASILKSGLEIKNRCTQERVNGENLASILKSGPEIKNRCITREPGREYYAVFEECRMGRDFGRRSRPWLRERGARRAAVGGKAPQVRTGPKSLPAGRVGRGSTVPLVGSLSSVNVPARSQPRFWNTIFHCRQARSGTLLSSATPEGWC